MSYYNNYGGYVQDNEKVALVPGLAPMPPMKDLIARYLTTKHLQRMRECLLAPLDAIPVDDKTYTAVSTKGEGYLFQDNGARVLAIAHLDTVQTTKHFYCVHLAGRPVVLSAQLDDRLGLWVLTDLLPAMGLWNPETERPPYDVLLTTGEESGHSSATEFIPPDRDYNWIFSFDRAGGDVVMYGYDDQKMRHLLKSYDFTPGMGSYSDIAALEWLGAKGFNFGTGYEDNHAITARAFLDTTLTMAFKFSRFWAGMAETRLPHQYVKNNNVANGRHYYGGSRDSDYYFRNGTAWRGAQDSDDEEWLCDRCHKPIEVRTAINGKWLCAACIKKEFAPAATPPSQGQLPLEVPAKVENAEIRKWPCETCGELFPPSTMYYNAELDKNQCVECGLKAGFLVRTPENKVIMAHERVVKGGIA